MKTSFLGSLILFFLSYFLLLIYFIFECELLNPIAFWKLNWAGVITIIILILALTFTVYIFKIKKLQKKVFRIIQKENISSETLNYLLTIFLAIFTITALSWSHLILVLLIFLVYIAGGLYYLQPILIIIGYRIYKCKIEGDNEIMIITKKQFKKDKNYDFYELFENIYLLKEIEDGN
ncbi:hypothetical protein M0R72_04270 [Candidatus Pacearchaeota archaeon]|jgi:predicted neutral ceramidase superfamily lipid hydrolase|nr:hypothetical protein [Candidatus Pacearchaeota archaeon]